MNYVGRYIIDKSISTSNGTLGIVVDVIKKDESKGINHDYFVCRKIKDGKIFDCPDKRCTANVDKPTGCPICQLILKHETIYFMNQYELDFYRKEKFIPEVVP